MKNILFLINTLAGGGAEKVLVDLVNNLDTTEYNIEVLSVTGGIHEKRLNEKINYRHILKSNQGVFQKILSKIIYHLPFSLFSFLFIKKKYDIEIAYLEGFPTRVISARKNNAKKLAFVHCDVSVQHVLKEVYPSYEQCLNEYKVFDKVCFVSEVAKKGFEKEIGKLDNSIVLHNVIDFDDAKTKSNENNELEYLTKGMKLIAVGRLSKEKGYDRLVHVVAELENLYDFELWLLGDGDEKSYIEDIIQKKNIKSVKLLGYQNNPYNYMKKADLFICPSFFEGYSTVVAESVALGIPVLTTDCAGMGEILVNGKYGWIVENSEDGLKNGLIMLLNNDDEYKKLKEQTKLYGPSCSTKNGVLKYEDLFKEILS